MYARSPDDVTHETDERNEKRDEPEKGAVERVGFLQKLVTQIDRQRKHHISLVNWSKQGLPGQPWTHQRAVLARLVSKQR